ncbi:hypothetical protein [Pedobacter nutrimenti]|jgi:hypothetical protein|uniref:TolB-like protein n=1 Tax=Pedobacter nutrimenti TaxID=1241337 RepID=A0A318UL95_9SPHI|nr:hypothetical protein [Pedobacter nutrimenti]PYF74795.1 hypothetical protein B0O44_103241 [Pedobacter nutrimenti]
MIKLEIVKQYETDHVEYLKSSTTFNESTAVLLTINKEDKFDLTFVSEDEMYFITLEDLGSFFDLSDKPVLFSMNNYVGVIKNSTEIYLYAIGVRKPEIVTINNPILPAAIRLSYESPVSDSDALAVCFEKDYYSGQGRYLAFLNLDTDKKLANWESWMNLDTKTFTYHRDQKYPPKIDSAMLKKDDLYIFTSGGMTTSVHKWGMDYFALVKSTNKGVVTETLLDSGDLTRDQKKRGVNGIFSSSEKYVLLTPVFQNDEWEGKQKIFSLETEELLTIEFPRSLGKYPQVIDHYGNYFWVYLRDKKHFAICREIH